MSTSMQELPDSTDVIERRFYSRVAPHAAVYLAIDDNNSLLLNVSENGLLVSSPVALPCNFVARIDIPLPGLPKPVQVNVRVVWANEIRKLAGIQLLDLNDHDREQIRKWGTRESTRFLHRGLELEEGLVVASPSAGESEPPADTSEVAEPSPAEGTEGTEEEIPSSEELILTGPVPPPTTRVPDPTVPEVTTSPAARIALWGMAIAAIFLAASFILKNSVAGSSFGHSKEILRGNSADDWPSPETPALPFHANPPNLDPSYSYVAANAGPPPRTLDARKSKHAASSAPASPSSTRTNEDAAQTADSANDEETLGASPFAPKHHDTAPANSTSAANTSLPGKPYAPSSHPSTGNRVESQNIPSRNAVTSGPGDTLAKSKSAASNNVIASAPAPSEAASKSATAFANSSPFTSTTTSATPGTPSASSYPPTANAPVRNPTRTNGFPATRAPAPIPSRPSSAPSGLSIAPRNASSPVIQMDTPEPQTMEIHLQGGYRGSFFNLPGERVLESSSATMRIQRSVRMPATHSLWPFNRNKKVVIGGLMSRVDPQVAQNQIRYSDIVRVTATVGQDGRIGSVKPIHGSANLLPNVLKAVQQWRYQPTLIDGKPVETQCDVLFQFHAQTDRRAQR
jgi:hypothetical protein